MFEQWLYYGSGADCLRHRPSFHSNPQSSSHPLIRAQWDRWHVCRFSTRMQWERCSGYSFIYISPLFVNIPVLNFKAWCNTTSSQVFLTALMFRNFLQHLQKKQVCLMLAMWGAWEAHITGIVNTSLHPATERQLFAGIFLLKWAPWGCTSLLLPTLLKLPS